MSESDAAAVSAAPEAPAEETAPAPADDPKEEQPNPDAAEAAPANAPADAIQDAPAPPEDPNRFSANLRDATAPAPKPSEDPDAPPPPDPKPLIAIVYNDEDRGTALAIDKALRQDVMVATLLRAEQGEMASENEYRALLNGALARVAALLVLARPGAELSAEAKELVAAAEAIKPPPLVLPLALVPGFEAALPEGLPAAALHLLPAPGSPAFEAGAGGLRELLLRAGRRRPAKTADAARALALEEALAKMHQQHVETEGARAKLEMENQVLRRNADNNRERQEAAERDATKWKQEARTLAEQVEPTKGELARRTKEMAAVQAKLADCESRLRSFGVDVKQASGTTARDPAAPGAAGDQKKSSACSLM
eukprot:tig00000237_g20470.t1